MLAILLVVGLGHANAQNNKPTLILTEDDSHFFGSRSAEQMTINGLHAFVDQYRDIVTAGGSSDVVLPVDRFKGSTFRIYIGPAPKKEDAFAVAGLAQSDGLALSRFEITINGKKCNPAADLTDLPLFLGVAREI